MALEDDNARQNSVAEYIYRQLHEADEANLLHEEGSPPSLFLSLVDRDYPFFVIQCVHSPHYIYVYV